ncbi:TPA: hypothetical protein ACH3X3_011277 [Trebouxia sp. C0006]
MLPKQRLPNGVERGARPYRLMKRPTILGCWHISQPRRGLVVQGLSPAERAPFFQQNLLPAMPIGTPLLRGDDWNCVAEALDLVGGQSGTRQHGLRP